MALARCRQQQHLLLHTWPRNTAHSAGGACCCGLSLRPWRFGKSPFPQKNDNEKTSMFTMNGCVKQATNTTDGARPASTARRAGRLRTTHTQHTHARTTQHVCALFVPCGLSLLCRFLSLSLNFYLCPRICCTPFLSPHHVLLYTHTPRAFFSGLEPARLHDSNTPQPTSVQTTHTTLRSCPPSHFVCKARF